MSNSPTPQPITPNASQSPALQTPVRRRRWGRWLAALLILLVAAVIALPYLATYPKVRNRLLGWVSARTNLHISVGELSLSWFSPVVAGDVKVANDDEQQAVLSLQRVEGDTPLWRVLLSSDAGGFRIVQPELNIEFTQQGNNLSRLLNVLAHSTFFVGRAARWEIVDGHFSLRGPNSKKPWVIDKLSLNVTATPASQNSFGVPLLRGGPARLLNETELTPEMCNELLKYIAPVFAQTTQASGRVSLDLDEFAWPLGKPEVAELKGKLTLHSVNAGPGEMLKLLASIAELKSLPSSVQIAKDDVVPFTMHDGRVYHENLAFSLAALQTEPAIRAHGSVGLDETLDWFLEFPALGSAVSSEKTVQQLLNQLSLHIVGTLSSPKISTPALKMLSDLRERRMEKREEQGKGGLLPGRRSESATPAAKP